MSEFIMIPTMVAEKHRRKQERDRLWRANQRYQYPQRDKRKAHHGLAPFVMWDGEGPRDAGYALFGNSEGYEICHPYLSTLECLELIMECEQEIPNAIHIGYGFNYDVSMILKDLPRRNLTALHHWTKTVWGDWELEHIPHKWFKVKHGQVSTKIYDIRSFFAGGYVDSLTQFGVGTSAEIARLTREKKRRESFLWSEIRDIREYWLLELRLGPVLAERLRTVFGDAGYAPRSWHGPGALARMALQRHKVYDAMADTPYDVGLAARYAFAGGRFELFKAGHAQGRVYNADINSAYPYYATQLPNLAKGKWRKGRVFEPGKFAIYNIRYCANPDDRSCYRPYPLFRRMPDNQVVWPYRTEGWYWAPEAELVADDPDARFVNAYIFDELDTNDRPFAWLEEYYRKRKVLKNVGNPAEYTFKLIINSVYGQLAQRAGWDRKRRTPPRSHQLEWAGFITSACRASVYRVARTCGDKLISIDTDGVSSLAPFGDVQCGDRLGEWDLAEYDDGIFWQSGIYSLREGDEWIKAKTRGIPKGSYTAEELLSCLASGEPLRLAKKIFVTYGLADAGRWEQRNTWQKEPHEYVMGGAGKRVHAPRACARDCGDMHRLATLAPLYSQGDPMSKRHYLPWLDPPDRYKETMDDLTWFDANHLDTDDEWVREYV
jgi:hypothetical protein